MPQMCSTKLIVFKLITIFFWVRNSDSVWKKKFTKSYEEIIQFVSRSKKVETIFDYFKCILWCIQIYITLNQTTQKQKRLVFHISGFFLLINSMDFKQSEILLHVIKQWNVAIFEHQPFCLSREICLKEKSLQYYLK